MSLCPRQCQVFDVPEARWVLKPFVPWLDPIFGDAAMPLTQADSELPARKVGTQAAVDSASERDMPVGIPVESNIKRLRALGGVDVGCPVDRYHLRSLLDLSPVGQLAILRGHSGQTERDRRLPPQQLLDRPRDAVRVVHDLATMVVVSGEEGIHTSKRIAHRIQTG